MIETVLMLASHLPIVDLFSNGMATSTGGFLYDVGQAVAGLHLFAKGVVAISEATPWEEDDIWARQLLGLTTSAMEFVARLGGAFQKGK